MYHLHYLNKNHIDVNKNVQEYFSFQDNNYVLESSLKTIKNVKKREIIIEVSKELHYEIDQLIFFLSRKINEIS